MLAAAEGASAKTTEPTVILDVGELFGITEHFVITSGANTRQVRTIAEEVERAVKAAGGASPRQTEGLSDATWVLIDWGDFIVHVFVEESRQFYALERLWSDAPRVEPLRANSRRVPV